VILSDPLKQGLPALLGLNASENIIVQKGYTIWGNNHETGHMDISVLSWFDPVRMAFFENIQPKPDLLSLHCMVHLHWTALPGFPIIG
jgi:hypothetical protein